MKSHKAAFDAGEIECLVILVVIILGAEVFIPVTGHILLEESHKIFEELVAAIAQINSLIEQPFQIYPRCTDTVLHAAHWKVKSIGYLTIFITAGIHTQRKGYFGGETAYKRTHLVELQTIIGTGRKQSTIGMAHIF